MNNSNILAQHLVPNLFDPGHYYQLDVRAGVMRNAFGTKCCTFSGYALRGLYLGLKHETGPAWRLVMRRCGEMWGQRFTTRFLKEIETFYNEGLDHMTMARFIALVTEYFAIAGWGRMRFDLVHIDAGLLLVEVQNEVLGDLLRDLGERGGVLLEGVLKALFAAVTEKEMECFETQSIGTGASISHFIISTRVRLSPVLGWLDEGVKHPEIVQRLLAA